MKYSLLSSRAVLKNPSYAEISRSAPIAFFVLNIIFLLIYVPSCVWLKMKLKSRIDRF